MKNIVEYLERSTKKNPDKIAVIDEFGKCTYQKLEELSKKSGSFLIKEGAVRVPVIVFMDKSIDALSTFLGIAYADSTYTLINPELPIARIEKIDETLNTKYVVTDKEHLEAAKEIFKNKNIYLVDELKKGRINEKELDRVRENFIDIDPLYTNFTSGSTGTPKGVSVCHRSVIEFIDIFTEEFNITKKDVIGNQAPFDFDVSVKDIYSSLCVGATLVIIPRRLFSSPAELLDFICDHDVTTMVWAVSALCLISTFHGLDYRVPSKVNKILFSGEVMPIKHLNKWMEALPKATFVNLYGPTEITCNCTYHVIDRKREYEKYIPIGKAFSNERVFLLDENDKLITEPETKGEICVSGTCLALGYYSNKEETDKHFTQNPLNKNYIELIYRTGDLGMYNKEQELVFQGRKDFQIKYNGHRIELEEIEKSMMKVEGIERACCLFNEEKQRLYGFYVGNMDKAELHTALKETLPVYMIPGILKQVDSMPLTKNGKIDRKELMSLVVK